VQSDNNNNNNNNKKKYVQPEPSQNNSENTWATYRESTKSRNYRKQDILGTAHTFRKVLM
jgi:hypothetical protein